MSSECRNGRRSFVEKTTWTIRWERDWDIKYKNNIYIPYSDALVRQSFRNTDAEKRPRGGRRCFQGDFVVGAVPRAEAPGLFSLRPSGDWNTHKKFAKLQGRLGESTLPGSR
jgi:hypothetical protein